MAYLSLPDPIARRLRQRASQLQVAPETLIEQWLDLDETTAIHSEGAPQGAPIEDHSQTTDMRPMQNALMHADVSMGIVEIATDNSYRLTYVNDAFYAFHGLNTSLPVDGLNVTLFGETNPDGVKALIHDLRRGEEICIEYKEIQPDGQSRWVEVNIVPVFEQDKPLQRGLLIEYDVTDQYESHRASVQSEKRLQTIIDSALVGIILTDNQANVITINHTGLDILGLHEKDIIGASSYTAQANVIKTDGSPFPGKEHAVPVAIRTRQPVHGMVMGVWRQSIEDYVWIIVNAVPHLDKNGEVELVVCSFSDITELRRTQQELQAINQELESHIAERTRALEKSNDDLRMSEDTLSTLITLAGDCIISIDSDQNIVMFNRAAEQVFGYLADEVIGKSLDMLMPRDKAVKHTGYVHIFRKSGEHRREMGAHGAVIGQRKDGTLFPAEAAISHYTVNGKQISTAILRDVTEKVKIDNQLRENEQRLRLLTDNATDMICLHTPDGAFVYVSPSSLNIIGYQPESLIHRNPYEFFHPDDLERIRDHHTRSLGSDNTEELTYRFRKPDGNHVWLEVTTRPIFDDFGDIINLVTVSRDVTERIKMQEELRQERDLLSNIMETSPSGINVVDRDGKIVYANKRTEDILGIKRTDITKRTYNAPAWKHTDFDGNPWPEEKQPFVRVMKTGQSVWNVQHAIEWPDGRRVYLSINGAPLFDENNEIAKVVFTVEDISDRRNAERTLLETLKKEREVNRVKTRFISLVTHEFNTPLAIILSAADALRFRLHTLDDPQINERLERIIVQVQNLKALLEDVTKFEDSDQLSHAFEVAPVDVERLLKRLISEVKTIYDQPPPIVFDHNFAVRTLNLDAQLITHIITNLLSNAIKYSGATDEIRITTRIVDGALELVIKDTGIGIPEEDHPTLFDFFHRGSNVGAISGTGVGLAIVNQAVKLHGGTIKFESKLNVGTTFIVRIPLNVSNTDDTWSGLHE